MKSIKRFILLNLFIIIGLNCLAQIQLLDIDFDECENSISAYGFKPIFKHIWLNDSTLQIKTSASANCIGVYNPKINQHGPLVCLEFDEFKLDTMFNKVQTIAADCNCVYCITWVLGGISKKSDFIILQNRQISSDQDIETLNRLLKSYIIDDQENYFFLQNAIDLDGLRQGIQVFRGDSVTSLIPYHNDKRIE